MTGHHVQPPAAVATLVASSSSESYLRPSNSVNLANPRICITPFHSGYQPNKNKYSNGKAHIPKPGARGLP